MTSDCAKDLEYSHTHVSHYLRMERKDEENVRSITLNSIAEGIGVKQH